MLINGMEAEYVVLSDPEPWMAVSPLQSPNVPSDESKIMLDGDQRPAVVVDVAVYDRWQAQYTFEEQAEQIREMWQAVRRFDAASIQHLPFLITAQQFITLVRQGRFEVGYSVVMPNTN